jgi:hypothetical protein
VDHRRRLSRRLSVDVLDACGPLDLLSAWFRDPGLRGSLRLTGRKHKGGALAGEPSVPGPAPPWPYRGGRAGPGAMGPSVPRRRAAARPDPAQIYPLSTDTAAPARETSPREHAGPDARARLRGNATSPRERGRGRRWGAARAVGSRAVPVREVAQGGLDRFRGEGFRRPGPPPGADASARGGPAGGRSPPGAASTSPPPPVDPAGAILGGRNPGSYYWGCSFRCLFGPRPHPTPTRHGPDPHTQATAP